jgi:hypothetical protein
MPTVKQELDDGIRDLALRMAVSCVRNTVIEKYHARGSISNSEMKAFNKEVANNLYAFLYYMLRGTAEERDALFEAARDMHPHNWDRPRLTPKWSSVIQMYRAGRGTGRLMRARRAAD